VPSPRIQRSGFADVDRYVLHEILRLRAEVFVVEQACVYLDLDGRDIEPATVHWWAEHDGAVVGHLRVIDDVGLDARRIGRVVTAPAWRNRGLAGALLDAAVTDIAATHPARAVVLDAQAHLASWYERRGFVVTGPEHLDDGIPHVPMRLVR
jgi:ElaA protein